MTYVLKLLIIPLIQLLKCLFFSWKLILCQILSTAMQSKNNFSEETLKELDAQSSFQYLKDTAQLEHKHKPYCFSARPQLNPP